VSFATNVRIRTDDSDSGITAPFARCLPSGCFAEFDLKDTLLKKLRAASGVGKLSFADAGGHDVAIPLSFKGFVSTGTGTHFLHRRNNLIGRRVVQHVAEARQHDELHARRGGSKLLAMARRRHQRIAVAREARSSAP